MTYCVYQGVIWNIFAVCHDVSYVSMRRATRLNESCQIFEWVIFEWVMSPVTIWRITCTKASYHTYLRCAMTFFRCEWGTPDVDMSHVTLMTLSCLTWQWNVQHTNKHTHNTLSLTHTHTHAHTHSHIHTHTHTHKHAQHSHTRTHTHTHTHTHTRTHTHTNTHNALTHTHTHTYVKVTYHRYQGVISHLFAVQVTSINEAPHTYECVQLYVSKSHVTHTDESRHPQLFHAIPIFPYIGHITYLTQYTYFHVTYAYGVATISRMLKIYVSLQNTGLFCRALLQKRPIFLSILLIVATLYQTWHIWINHVSHTYFTPHLLRVTLPPPLPPPLPL